MKTLTAATILATATITAAFADEPTPAPPKAESTHANTTPTQPTPPATAAEAKPLTVGDPAPGARLVDASGHDVELADAFAAKPTLLIFYRGGWCPFCNAHLAQVSAIRNELEKLGINIVAISPEDAEHVKENAERGAYGYTLLGDPDGTAIRAYGIAFRLDDATATKYREYGIDLEERSGGRSNRILPVPAAFLIDSSGTIRYAHTNPDYRKRADPQTILDAARSILVAQDTPPDP